MKSRKNEIVLTQITRWQEVPNLLPTDPIFSLPILALTKLNAFRDQDYLQRTMPDLASFRIAHRFAKVWAKQRGIYASRFGYLGGFHITLMLSRICKLLIRQTEGNVTAADIIFNFFNHYAHFDWSIEMVIDPDFHKTQTVYQRSAREPMVILSLHAPRVNVSRTASLPSLQTIVDELKRADNLLSDPGVTWQQVIGGAENGGAREFLKTYNSYIKINVQFWGSSSEKESSLLGWLESKCPLFLVGKFPLPPSLPIPISIPCSHRSLISLTAQQISTANSPNSTPASGQPDLECGVMIKPTKLTKTTLPLKAAISSASKSHQTQTTKPRQNQSANSHKPHSGRR